jgi:tetratricopeptide (TPR) repeat protein
VQREPEASKESEASSGVLTVPEAEASESDLWRWFIALVSAGAASDAVVIGQELESRRPANPQVLLGLASARRAAGECAAALDLAGRAAVAGANQCAVALVRAEAYLDEGDFERAFDQAEISVSGNPDDPIARQIEVRCLLSLGRYTESSQAAATLVGMSPGLAQNHWLLSVAREKLGDLPGAIAAQREVIRLASDSGQTLRLGELLVSAGERREGIETLAAAAEARPGDLALRERITLLVDHGGFQANRAATGLILIASCALGFGIVVIAAMIAVRIAKRRSYSSSVRTALREWSHRRGHGISATVWMLLGAALFLSVILPLLIYSLTASSVGFILILPGIASAFVAMYQYQRDLPRTYIRPSTEGPPGDCQCDSPNVVAYTSEAAESYSAHLNPLAVYPVRGFQTLKCEDTLVTWLARRGNRGIAYIVRLPDQPRAEELSSDYNGAYL